jgi:16S rRNA (guanine966-N2)-methyltransferase
MSLKVLGGSLGGRLLKSPRGDQTRPTTSMLRKAVFDMLQSTIVDTHFLDLFAGSGAMGIEALSRGAKNAAFVENHKETLRCLKENLHSLKLEEQAAVYPYDVFLALKKLEKKGQTFEIIYADPPYHIKSIYTELLSFLDASSLMAPGSLLFLESLSPSPLKRRFGTSLLHQYRYTK